jgi:hypothetical protein
VFVAKENIVCTLKWPSFKAKIGKRKKSKFGRIHSWNQNYQCFSEVIEYVFCVLSRKYKGLFPFPFKGLTVARTYTSAES